MSRKIATYKKELILPLRQATLCFLVDGDSVCLAMKKRGFGEGKWNGVGGKVEKGETVEDAVVREAKEEIEVTLRDIEKVAVLDFYNPHKPEWDQQVIVYLCREWNGDPKETEEMKPKWFDKKELPFDVMWKDDKYWLIKVLSGEKVKGEFLFNPRMEIEEYQLFPLQ